MKLDWRRDGYLREETMTRTIVGAAMLVALACCGGEVDSPVPSGQGTAIPGVYQLRSTNGRDLPGGDGQHLFVNGVLDLGADGTWCMEMEWRGSLYSRVSADRGTFTTASGAVSFASPEGENATFAGTVDSSGRVTVGYVFGGVSDRFTFSQPADSLTPHCDR